tara:strand:+ start:124 stop:807 length:684 start_codon:yes stop_codon:yes gene_type:complete
MGRQKRTDTINYCILFLHNKKTNTRLLDLTTKTNVRNYKYMLKQSYVDKTKKFNYVLNNIRSNGEDINDIRVEVLQEMDNTTYSDACNRLKVISNELNLDSRFALSNDVKELLIKIDTKTDAEIQAQQELIQQASQQTEKCAETPLDAVKEIKHDRVLCECGASVIKMNMTRHKKTKKHLDYIASKCVKVPLETITADNVVDCETHEIVVSDEVVVSEDVISDIMSA